MLDSPARARLRAVGDDVDHVPCGWEAPQISKAPDFMFDAIEICGGSGVLSKALAKEGLNVAMPLDISTSKHFDLVNVDLLNWVLHMIAGGRILAVICEPPCTTFSPAQHPASRSYAVPLGFDRTDQKTLLGNCLAFRCLTIMWFAMRCNIVGLLEQPRLSKMAWLSPWKFLLKKGCAEAVLASCAFGSIHKKEFKLLGTGLNMSALNVRCSGGHSHVRVEGKYTKESAVYVPKLAEFIAKHVAAAVQELKLQDLHDVPVAGLESAIINDLLCQPGWAVHSEWDWRRAGHINVLESRSYVALLKGLVLEGGDLRFCAFLDSRVAKGSHAKGRSSAAALRPSLLRGCALSVAGNLHPSLGFAPTRLNTADAPTRLKPLPLACRHSILDFLSQYQVALVHSCQFSKAAVGWVRLYILIAFCFCPGESCDTGAIFFPHGISGIMLQFWTLAASLIQFGFSLSLVSLLGFSILLGLQPYHPCPSHQSYLDFLLHSCPAGPLCR